ncbi:NUDIX hydrolase [Rhizobium cremeum]|uniref:NUDIX hydrolase n=1 Tax=Rhizobium cremeum TaxID=2813827 RepID=UPI001FD2DE23|nr:NUDIX hydrolase [Rhizobium cremeum]MCJ7993257.1 NUDIX hydrolase [Rhizobium cremeum]MCJ7998322.1 NUDIX hydrolase [Rhizobium cremeum]
MNELLLCDQTGMPGDGRVFPMRDISLRVLEGEHPFHVAHKTAAAENWKAEIAEKPALFDGDMVLQHKLDFRDGTLKGEAFIAPYSTFLWWRRQPEGLGAFHAACFPVIISSDDALIAVEMASHTANAGQVYFAAGSLDRSDIVDGYCDLGGNMRREVREETGLDLAQASSDGRLFGSYRNRRLIILQCFRFDEPATRLLDRIAAHMLVDEEKEIAGAVAIRTADPHTHFYNRAMLPLLEWFFDERRQSGRIPD